MGTGLGCKPVRGEVPDHYIDITREVSRMLLDRATDTIIGADKVPHLAGAVFRIYRDPDDDPGEQCQPVGRKRGASVALRNDLEAVSRSQERGSALPRRSLAA